MSTSCVRARLPCAAKPRTYPPLTYIAVVLVLAFVALGACGTSSGDSSAGSTGSAPPEMPFTVEGRGEFVSDDFLLEPGKLRATINVSGNTDQSGTAQSVTVTLFTAALGHPSLLVEAVTASGNWQTTTTVRDRPHFYLDVVATGEWTVTLEPV